MLNLFLQIFLSIIYNIRHTRDIGDYVDELRRQVTLSVMYYIYLLVPKQTYLEISGFLHYSSKQGTRNTMVGGENPERKKKTF